MDQIPTLDYIKRQAKKLRKELGITHTEALENVAKQYGFANWINCQRTLNQKRDIPADIAANSFQLNFTDWLRKHVKRDSPLGDLARDMSDKSWPSYTTVEQYCDYLHDKNAVYEAIQTLNRAWKTYTAYVKRKNSPQPVNSIRKKVAIKNYDERKITFVKNVKPLHFEDRRAEKFEAGDKAWISWTGSKAIPATVISGDERNYKVRLERPLAKAGKITYSLFADEVRSTPELACLNMVSM
ncbi:YozE family protein [Flavobacterium sp. BFFFF1]|uniref:YozE family protein n=1 Tax=Flavobacterium sp. BFFFF1 TaxID=2015557 RepID=UPI0025BC46E4|nr:YozE family protein [Flavobacterium sp. BFFFF1]